MGCGARGDPWDVVRGQHDVGQVIINGEALLIWCAQNGLTVINTASEEVDTSVHMATP